jgi:hypothetical protein
MVLQTNIVTRERVNTVGEVCIVIDWSDLEEDYMVWIQ